MQGDKIYTRNEAAIVKCTLMHKRTAVVDIEVDNATGFIRKINGVYAPKHLPVGVLMRRGLVNCGALNEWWTQRSIPASRSGIREALEKMDISSTLMLLIRCYGLSLSDQYWICPEGSGLSWDKINFFDNVFSDDIGDVLFGTNKNKNALDFSSPDNTSDGNLKKRWKIIDGRRCLVKGGSNPFHQQPFNEVIAAEIMERLGISHVPYTVIWNEGVPYSVCEDFVEGDTELVPAWRIIQTQKKSNSTSAYQHFVGCCQALGVKAVVPFLDRMIVVDYIIANEDRHLNNFGLLRNAQTLEWCGFAPIYDSGSSLGYDRVAGQILGERDVECKPFKKHHAQQLRLVSDFSWIDFDSLTDVGELITNTLSSEEAKEYIDENRIHAIVEAVNRRIQNLRQISMEQLPGQSDFTQDDVEENRAKDYSL